MKNRDMKELREKCIEMDELLKKENIKIWEGMFKKFAEEIEKNKEINEIKREIKYNINNLFPPREGLTEYYIFLENRKEMIIVNQEIKELRENLYSLYRKI